MHLVSWHIVAVISLLGVDQMPVGAQAGPSNSLDGTWEVYELEIRDGKQALRCSMCSVRMEIKGGTGTWSNDSRRGAIKVDLSGFREFSLGFSSAPFDLTYTTGRDKGQTWQGLCSRCGSAVVVWLSLKQRPQEWGGSDAQPIIVFRFELQEK